jgi:C4-dicarboxylate-specific signal transduction histidine kinase
MDRGAGVEPAATEQLFEPFFTTKPDGLGLGLNICRTIIESHGGHLTFENRADGGAIFSLQLPTVV